MSEMAKDDSIYRALSDLGNEIHNLSCELQNDERISEVLSSFASRAWRIAAKVDALECEA